MKNFIDNILGIVVAIISLIIIVGIMVLTFAIVMNFGGDFLTSVAVGIFVPVGIIGELGLI